MASHTALVALIFIDFFAPSVEVLTAGTFLMNTYYVLNIVKTVVAPYLLNPQEANLQGKAAFPAAGLTLMLAVWAWLGLPELKGLTGETLDSLFERKVPARRFLKAAKELQHVR
ncbi:hypothetical protein VD0002_g5739 [Verticillium dahliae]|nr:Endoglucanase-1 [Verticillium dahliae VDG2]KAH6702514.1 MFS maltose permease MalP [Verticillium dahliae]PNH36448.1 hypothetical protein BJF96_g169 [Verticillium dahliae]PNH40171.1 hypothetical protein VD0004_g6795 [Verticillium dahliae]PNH53364.1 hypothetical protein VD0003_g4045 [Verticillium dahliae]